VDSRDKVLGTNTNFTIQFQTALHNVHKATLLFGNLGTTETNTESYFLIQIPELGVSCRNANDTAGTFILPITRGSGYRSIHQISSDFSTSSNSAGISIDSLNVRIINRNGQLAPDTGDILLIIEIE
jgi:hypothetical protein